MFLDQVDTAWRPAFELAWKSFRAGSIPVGAVLVDETGEIVARSRNRIFASRDAYGGGALFELDNPHTARQPLVVEGPLDGQLGGLGELLHVAHFLWRKPDSIVVAAHRANNPGVVELGERLDLMSAARDGATLDDLVALIARESQ